MQNKKWWSGVAVGFCAAVGMFVYGCQSEVKKVENPASGIADVRHDIAKSAETLNTTTTEIKQSATTGQQKTPPAVRPTLDPYWGSILVNAGKQETLVKDLQDKDTKFNDLQAKADALSKHDSDETIRANKAEASVTDGLRRNLHYFVLAGVVGISIAGVLIFTGNPKGIALGVGSAILTGVSLFIGQTAQLIPWIVGGVVVVCSGFLIWHIIEKKREAAAAAAKEATLQKACVQLVKHDEGVKQLLTTQSRRKAYGDGAVVGLAHIVQDSETQAIVEKIRSQIKKAPSLPASPTIDYNGDGVIDDKDVYILEEINQPEVQSMAKKPKRKPVSNEEIWTCRPA